MAAEQVKKRRKQSAQEPPRSKSMHQQDQQVSTLKSTPALEKRKRAGTEAKNLDTSSKPVPPGMLLTLLGAFFISYGFHETSRQFATELASRKDLEAWQTELAVARPSGFPDLVTVYRDWYHAYQEKPQLDKKKITASEGQGIKQGTTLKKRTQLQKGDARDKETSRVEKKVHGSRRKSDPSSDSSSVSTSVSSSVTSSVTGSDVDSIAIGSDGKVKEAEVKSERLKRAKQTSSSSSSLPSDSDADDEKEAFAKKSSDKKGASEGSAKAKQKPSSRSSLVSESTPHSDPLPLNGKKPAKANTQSTESKKSATTKTSAGKKSPKVAPAAASSSSSSSSTSSSSDSSSAEEAASDPKPQIITKPAQVGNSSSSTSSSEEEEEVKKFPPPPKVSKPVEKPTVSKPVLPASKSATTDSSVTLGISSPTKPSTSRRGYTRAAFNPATSANAVPTSKKRPYPFLTSPDEPNNTNTNTDINPTNEEPVPAADAATAASPPAKKPRTPHFQRVPSDTKVDPKLASNAYRGHDYGDRAHQDLSVTRGRNFTKEKAKKKRGSYRGGAIDISGGKGVKF